MFQTRGWTCEWPLKPASIRFRGMGVLDDAIREHLELKRRHGAPEQELQRQEEEALGPVRREVEPASEETDPPGNGQHPGDTPDAVSEGAPDAAESEVAPFDGEAAHAVPPAAGPDGPLPESDEPEAIEEPEPEPFNFQRDAGADHPPQGSRRFERESHLSEDEGAAQNDPDLEAESEEPGDVLEDTPDFLEETPEHDRLWFEQKPPRDFDFD
jgi:hypothetical protein